LCQEFRTFFPENAVGYFVSYFDYYQPEAYLPSSDVYIEKDSAINDEIDRLRHWATTQLLSRKDVIIVASVSCLYGLGSPEDYKKEVMTLSVGDVSSKQDLVAQLVDLYYSRNETMVRGTFRTRGETVEVAAPDQDVLYRIEFDSGKVHEIVILDKTSRNRLGKPDYVVLFPAKHFVMPEERLRVALNEIDLELKDRLAYFQKKGRIVEAERLERRTKYDMELMREIGYCKGIENYSRILTGRKPGSAPYTLIDYFPRTPEGKPDFLTIIDESHVTLPQIQGMWAGDRARKEALVEYGFRLPSTYDNRPLNFDEFSKKVGQCIYLSATPGPYEKKHSDQIVEQIIRPTGLVDPAIEIKPIEGQVDDVINEIEKEAKLGNRVLVTTLTKKMAENLAQFLQEREIKAKYLHSDVDTLDRIRILKDLRLGKINCLVGVNLLREGLDLPEVSLVGILDADKEGFLRSETSLIQTMGRVARHLYGRVILYADEITGSMERALAETKRRREAQVKYNAEHGITPIAIKKAIESIVADVEETGEEFKELINIEELPKMIKEKEAEMKRLATELNFEEAALVRDEVKQLKKYLNK
jgi:excinuclease ABC subunit B